MMPRDGTKDFSWGAPPPQLLVSVRSVTEAHAAVAGGADVIDIKDPARGPMGMASRDTIAEVFEAVRNHCPVSVALGELADNPDLTDLPASLAFAKVALAGMKASPDWRTKLATLLAPLMSEVGVHPAAVVVAYADASAVDAPAVEAVLTWVLDHPVAGLLIDTAQKNGKGLFDWLEPDQLRSIHQQLHAAGKLCALAGSLKGDGFERAVRLRPSIVGVRGAACTRHDRHTTIDPAAVAILRDLVHTEREHPVARLAKA